MGDKTFKNQKNIEDALKLLKIVVRILDNHNIKYYLDFGTLIGAMRDNAFIPWDDDIDISLVNEEDYKKIPEILEEIKKEYGYRTYLHTFKQSIDKFFKKEKINVKPNINFTDEENYQIAKIRNNKFWRFGRGNTCIDIFFKYKYEKNIYWFAYGKVHKISLNDYNDEIMQIDFYGISCKVLTGYDKYLHSIYGDWKTPNEIWSQNTGNLSIQ